jgi:hypothetical protein
MTRCSRTVAARRYLAHGGQTTEPFTMIDPYIIDYQITIEDQRLFTAPIRVAGSFVAAVNV